MKEMGKPRDGSKTITKQVKSQSNSKFVNKRRKPGMRFKSSGPRLPSSLRKEIDGANGNLGSDDDEIDSDEGNDVYEYEEELPEEESKKNRRFDPVENFEYELPDEFKDEDVLSEDDDNMAKDIEDAEEEEAEEEEEEDEGRHMRMLQGVTGMPRAAFEVKKRNDELVSEPYPESEYNPTRDILDGEGCITMEDLLNPLRGKPVYKEIKRSVNQMKSLPIHAPLPKPDQERMERKVVKEAVSKQLASWLPLVKKNREARTLFFNEDVDMNFSTVGAIASEFEPRTAFEKTMASLVRDDKVMEAHKEDGARLLELNEISVEDHIKDRDRIAKVRSLLFRHELKSKRIKKIKSKTFHRLKNKDKMKAGAGMLLDPEAAKEEAMKQEYKRAEERMTLRHKNKSKWAKHVLRLGLNARDEGTRAAIQEQLHLNASLTRKINSMKDDSSSDDSSDDDNLDEHSTGSDEDKPSKLLSKAKQKTLKILEEDEEVPKTGVLSLPFMVRGLKKRNEAAIEEAKDALREYEEMEGDDGVETQKPSTSSGRRVFGAARKEATESRKKTESNNFYDNSDSEEDNIGSIDMGKDVGVTPDLPGKSTQKNQDATDKNFNDIVHNAASKTTFDVAIFASGSLKKMTDENKVNAKTRGSEKVANFSPRDQDTVEEAMEGSDADSEEKVGALLSVDPTSSYQPRSQEELLDELFAGDDVKEDFEKEKQDVLNEENPEPEKPVLLPGWGQWSNIQRKRGMVPSWMQKQHEEAKRKREESLKNRKDARLRDVIISEKSNKQVEKLYANTVPYPFTSKEVYEQSIRMPLGPEFNPATTVGALNRPEVVKKSGQIIKPVKFETIREKSEDHQRSGQKRKQSDSKSSRQQKQSKGKKISK